jgi:alpha-glucosidase (family GH31 glycosyl hydrolase)
LTLAGPPCNIYGNDIADLTLVVEYQSQQRLAVRIYPKHVDSSNTSHYILDSEIVPQPHVDHGYDAGNSDLVFTWSNDPSFAFKVARKRNGEVLFDTTGSKLVFEDQFLELSTNMVDDYNIYGLAESLHSFRLGTNWTQTFWASLMSTGTVPIPCTSRQGTPTAAVNPALTGSMPETHTDRTGFFDRIDSRIEPSEAVSIYTF